MFSIESYGNYSSFGIITKWNECDCCGCNVYPYNILFDLIIIIPILIMVYFLIKKLYDKR